MLKRTTFAGVMVAPLMLLGGLITEPPAVAETKAKGVCPPPMHEGGELKACNIAVAPSETRLPEDVFVVVPVHVGLGRSRTMEDFTFTFKCSPGWAIVGYPKSNLNCSSDIDDEVILSPNADTLTVRLMKTESFFKRTWISYDLAIRVKRIDPAAGPLVLTQTKKDNYAHRKRRTKISFD